jgi:hypothetical protein
VWKIGSPPVRAATRLLEVHSGQSGQPRPDALSRTAAPVIMIPAFATTPASATRRIDVGVGKRKGAAQARAPRRVLAAAPAEPAEAGLALAEPALTELALAEPALTELALAELAPGEPAAAEPPTEPPAAAPAAAGSVASGLASAGTDPIVEAPCLRCIQWPAT